MTCPNIIDLLCVTAGYTNEFAVALYKRSHAFRVTLYTPSEKVVFLGLPNSYFEDLFGGWNWHCFTIKRDGNMSVCFKLLVLRVHSN